MSHPHHFFFFEELRRIGIGSSFNVRTILLWRLLVLEFYLLRVLLLLFTHSVSGPGVLFAESIIIIIYPFSFRISDQAVQIVYFFLKFCLVRFLLICVSINLPISYRLLIFLVCNYRIFLWYFVSLWYLLLLLFHLLFIWVLSFFLVKLDKSLSIALSFKSRSWFHFFLLLTYILCISSLIFIISLLLMTLDLLALLFLISLDGSEFVYLKLFLFLEICLYGYKLLWMTFAPSHRSWKAVFPFLSILLFFFNCSFDSIIDLLLFSNMLICLQVFVLLLFFFIL